jgi:hypothetical protein
VANGLPRVRAVAQITAVQLGPDGALDGQIEGSQVAGHRGVVRPTLRIRGRETPSLRHPHLLQRLPQRSQRVMQQRFHSAFADP